ncbi:sigma-70 family RNA polymerase sigma factor [Azospirillum sp. sgz302134]
MPTAFETDLVGCIPELQRYARRLAGEQAMAEDLVQDCLERALRNADKFQPGTNLDAWLVTILKNIFFSERRRCRRCPVCELEEDDRTVPPAQLWCVALDETQAALEELPPAQRGLVEMVAIEGIAYQDAADRLGVPVGTIRSRLSRAREQIRVHLERRRRTRIRIALPPQPLHPQPAPAAQPQPSAPAPNAPATGKGLRHPRPSRLPATVALLPHRTHYAAVRIRFPDTPERCAGGSVWSCACPSARSPPAAPVPAGGFRLFPHTTQ